MRDEDNNQYIKSICWRWFAGSAKVVSEPDKGMYHAMNKGLLMASGDVVAILNADDYYPSNDVLAKVIDAFTDPEIDACYGDLIYVDSKDTGKVVRFWRSGDYIPQVLVHMRTGGISNMTVGNRPKANKMDGLHLVHGCYQWAGSECSARYSIV